MQENNVQNQQAPADFQNTENQDRQNYSQGGNPTLAIVIVIVAVLALGALYVKNTFFTQKPEQQIELDEAQATPEEASEAVLDEMLQEVKDEKAGAISNVSDSDDIDSIEADLQNTDLDSLDVDLGL